MAASSYRLSQDQFVCPICLDVLTDPVATPCGHNFCKSCITQHWAVNTPCRCPMCKEVFYSRPELRVNTLISQMAAQFRQTQPEPTRVAAEEVSCDVCTGTKLGALKSCLVCLASYCGTHLEPHLTVLGLKKHQLIHPVGNLQVRMCMKHDKPLELYCKIDQMCVCMLCMVLDHKTHNVVPVKTEYQEKKNELDEKEAEIQQMIQKREVMIGQLKHSVEVSNESANTEKEQGLQVFAALKEPIDRSLAEFIETIDNKHRPIEKQTKGLVADLEQEMFDLKKKSEELKQLSCSEDHFQFLQTFSSLKEAKDWTGVSIRQPSYKGTVAAAVAELEEALNKEMQVFFEAELKRVQQYATNVTLDPETANPWLLVSDDRKQVTFGELNKNLPDNPKRFSYYASVLSKNSFSSGRFYFEVLVEGKTKWDLGVASESVDRKGQITLSPLNGYWTVSLRNGNEYKAFAESRVCLRLKSVPKKVGVFVDYEDGLVSLYDVDTAAVLYSFTGCSFTDKLFVFFNPCNSDCGRNSAPLVICPIQNLQLTQLYSRVKNRINN
ncbi:E3 ubiquitin-protein ligase TRIM39 [Pleuronectes platessa]|uniref:E3 ubiquitin-protein ligase TRIM39 n=1 Tax=Pleuronectes platessa TaxID=8262 RepID=UPI00232A3531|nr:E3 ubiquitin-protein ligase TRIM39 [Pleuronectes platessa]